MINTRKVLKEYSVDLFWATATAGLGWMHFSLLPESHPNYEFYRAVLKCLTIGSAIVFAIVVGCARWPERKVPR